MTSVINGTLANYPSDRDCGRKREDDDDGAEGTAGFSWRPPMHCEDGERKSDYRHARKVTTIVCLHNRVCQPDPTCGGEERGTCGAGGKCVCVNGWDGAACEERSLNPLERYGTTNVSIAMLAFALCVSALFNVAACLRCRRRRDDDEFGRVAVYDRASADPSPPSCTCSKVWRVLCCCCLCCCCRGKKRSGGGGTAGVFRAGHADDGRQPMLGGSSLDDLWDGDDEDDEDFGGGDASPSRSIVERNAAEAGYAADIAVAFEMKPLPAEASTNGNTTGKPAEGRLVDF